MKARMTPVKSPHPKAIRRPLVCFIPGGPGLSSATLRSMDVLARSFDLAYIDIQDEPMNPTFYSIADAMEAEIIELKRPVVLCGHSFGALFSIEILKRRKIQCAALMAIAAPLSDMAYEVATEQYFKYMTPELKSADAEWERNPSRETLQRLLASYGTLYFSPKTVDQGNALLLSDPVLWRTFRDVLSILSKKAPRIDFVGALSRLSMPKHMIAGTSDLMLPPKTLLADAETSGCGFHEVADAGHFVTFDQPEAVARLIEGIIIDSKTG